MPLTSNDIKVYQSTAGDGGAITASEALPFDFFGSISGAENAAGVTKYACVYVRNNSTTNEAKSVKVCIDSVDEYVPVTVAIGAGVAGAGQIEPSPLTNQAPAGVTFSAEIGPENAPSLGDIPIGSYKPLWVRMVVPANTPPKNRHGVQLTVAASTGE